jgi:hypothetical protein
MEFRRFVAAGGLVVGLVGAWPASAVLPPQAYLQARREAALHLQVKVQKVRLRPSAEACLIEGRVLRAFRGDARPGARIIFDAPCRFPGAVPMPGPVLWFQPDDLKKGQVLEGFFDGTPTTPAIARSQLFVVASETDAPRCGTEDYACQ